MTRAQYAKARQSLQKKFQKECDAMAKKYISARVPLKRNVVYEAKKGPRGLSNRFVVFVIRVQHYLEVGMFECGAGVWWLDKNGACSKWETLHGVDNPNGSRYTKSKDQKFIKPTKPE